MPAGVGEATTGQKRTAPSIRRAVQKSARAAGDDFAVEVATERPRSVLNIDEDLLEFSRLLGNHLPGKHDQQSHGKWATVRAKAVRQKQSKKSDVAITLGRKGAGGAVEDLPSPEIETVVRRAVDSARKQLRQAGIDDKYLQEVRIFSDPSVGYHGLAKGEGRVDINLAKERLEQLEEIFADSRASIARGEVPSYAFQSVEDMIIHEVGHNVHRGLSQTDYRRFEEAFRANDNYVEGLPSFFAQENSSEAFAESFLAAVQRRPFGGTAAGYGPTNYAIRDLVLEMTGIAAG